MDARTIFSALQSGAIDSEEARRSLLNGGRQSRSADPTAQSRPVPPGPQLPGDRNGAAGAPAPAPLAALIPLSAGQAGLWALQKSAPGSAAYHLPICLRIEGELNRAAFATACEMTLRQHPILSTRVAVVDGSPFLCPAAHTRLEPSEEDAAQLDDAMLAERMREFVQEPFALDRGPLLRVRLYHGDAANVVVLFVVHHIIFDGASIAPFVTTLMSSYRAAADGRHPDAGAPPQDLADFAQWEQDMVGSRAGEAHLRYWKAALLGASRVLDLPRDFPRPTERGFSGRTVRHCLAGEAASGINALAARGSLNRSSIFLALFATLLHRYAGQDDFVVGVPGLTRTRSQFADRIGYFINMLPQRIRFHERQTFSELAEAVQRGLLDGYDHAEYPFARLVQQLAVERDELQSPIFQVAFYYQNYLRPTDLASLKELAAQAPRMEFLDLVRQEGEYELALEVLRDGEAYALVLKYDPKLFAPWRIEMMTRHLVQLAQEVARNPDRPLAECEFVTEEEKQTLRRWNDTGRSIPQSRRVHEMISAQARRVPDKTALICGGMSMSYSVLDERTGALAAWLRSCGVGAGSRVALCVERSIDMVVGLIGILKAGAAYVPLDPANPDKRLAYMIADAEVTAIVAQRSTRAKLGILTVPVIELDGAWDDGTARHPPQPNGGAEDDLAYVIYTSGSTGQPKGVMIGHRALSNFLCAMAAEPGLAASDRMLAVTTCAFDIAALELFLPLVQGATCVICDDATARNPGSLQAEIARMRPTVMQATPATWTMLLNSGWRNERKIKILCGGDTLGNELACRLLSDDAEVWNMFGPTETTIWSLVGRVRPNSSVTIGRPVANTRIYIVDRGMKLMPPGIPGELCIAGEGLAQGYWRQAALTAEKFVANPFEPGGRIYRTGDLARWRNDGEIEFLGRLDRQIKLRGFRIETEEIERTLVGHPAISECALVAPQSPVKQLVAYYVRDPTGPTPSGDTPEQAARAFQEFLRETLPEYMVPARLVELAAMPLTANGKLDFKALEARPLPPPSPGAAPPEAETATERGVLKIWREVLGNDLVKVEDAFFEAGGNSLTAVHLIERLNQEFLCQLTVTGLFKYHNVRRLSAHIEAQRSPDAPARPPTLGATPADAAAGPARLPDYYERSIAIIGMSCRFAEARDHRAFWDNLRAGKECIATASPEELSRAGLAPDLIADPRLVPVRSGIDGQDLFDADFFGIMPRDAQYMDPQFRLLLLHSWHAVEDAGWVPHDIPLTGVFMSASSHIQQSPLPHNPPCDEPVLTSAAQYAAWVLAQSGSIPTMISYKLGLIGPSMFVHSNCSSSLTGLHLARLSLLARECDCALVGAAALSPSRRYGYLHQQGLNLSAAGHVRAFDEAADGMVGGEGVVVVLLKRAPDAIRDGDNIYALLRATAVNNDGAEKASYYAPSVNGQARVITQALQVAGVDPASISYVEAHGTGTKLGDPVEIAALSEAYARHTDRRQYCAVGSVKSNLGHLDGAAGLAGCVKVALSLKNGSIPPSINYSRPNPHIDFANSPFFVAAEELPWPEGAEPARAALSSFGLGGSNGHAILERLAQPPAGVAASRLAPPHIVPLSARCIERLTAYAGDLAQFMERENPQRQLSVADIAYTLQVGRAAMATRIAFVVRSRDDLLRQLRDYCDAPSQSLVITVEQPETQRIAALVREASDPGALAQSWCRDGNPDAFARSWVAGFAADWLRLYPTVRPARVSLPGYPFAPVRVGAAELGLREREAAAANPLHAVLDENTGDRAGWKFSVQFTGQEFFLSDHVIAGRRTLPASAYLEMAYAAAGQTMADIDLQSRTVFIKNVMWSRPLIVSEQPVRVHTDVTPDINGDLSYRTYTMADGDATAPLIHSIGTIQMAVRPAPPSHDLQAISSRCTDAVLQSGECYRAFAAAGLDYGPSHQGLISVAIGADEAGEPQALARIGLPSGLAHSSAAFHLHPSLLDAALQASLVLASRSNPQGPTLPYALAAITVYARCPPSARVVVTRSGSPARGNLGSSWDLDLCDEFGTVCARLEGFVSRPRDGGAANDIAPGLRDTLLFVPQWTEAPLSPPVTALPGEGEIRRAVVFCDFDRSAIDGLECGAASVSWLNSAGKSAAEQFVDCAVQLKRFLLELTAVDSTVAAHVVVGETAGGPFLAGVAALLKTAAQENPKLFAQLIEIDAVPAPPQWRDLLVASRRLGGHVRYADGKCRVMRWLDCDDAAAAGSAMPWRDGGVYLITGGAGAIGLKIAGEVAGKARKAQLILVGRSARLLPSAQRRIDDLAASGARIEYLAADVSDRSGVERLMAAVRTNFGTLHGIIHAAGVTRDRPLARKSDDEFRQVLSAKVAGTVWLDALSEGFPLDFFILFSSISGVFGNPGQADYAAANAYCDAFARARQALVDNGRRRGHTVSIDWPLWASGGIGLAPEAAEALARDKGLLAMPDAPALAALYRAIGVNAPQVLVLYGDGARIRPAMGNAPPAQRVAADDAAPARADDDMDAAGASEPLLYRMVGHLKAVIEAATRLPAERIDPGASFETIGIDSMMIAELTTALEKTFGSLPKTLFFEYRNLLELAQYFMRAHLGRVGNLFGVAQVPAAPDDAGSQRRDRPPLDAVPGAAQARRAQSGDTEPPKSDVAIIGIAGRYPKACDLDEFWDNLRAGRDCITEIPRSRWDHSAIFDRDKSKPGKTYSKWGGFLDDVDKFDALFFNISPREAEYMDPQERLFLECTYEALENAGYSRDHLAAAGDRAGTTVGVFAGMMYEEYQLYGAQETLLGRPMALSGSPASIANRVSYFCNFHGPSVAVDTMCSSSLTAIHMACLSLRCGDCDLAIAGGVNVSVHPNKYLMLGQGKFVSSKGRCESFGVGGDGYVPGEGVGAVILKPLDRAVADGDQIHAVIKGTAVNHGGKTSGYSVPNPNAQAAVIGRAIARSGIDPATISFIEAHGTGTALGDPIEIAALSKCFAAYTDKKQFCAIGSVKSNVGHGESAAGICGLTKVLLQMRHQELVPSLHAEVLNPDIDFADSPFIVQRSLSGWARPVVRAGDGTEREFPRRAGISSFGAGGSNAHVIVEEYVAGEPAPPPATGPFIIVLSARSERQLRQVAARLVRAVSSGRYHDHQLGSIAYTLHVGRDAMDHRLATCVTSVNELEQRLAAFAAGETDVRDLHLGHARANRAILGVFSGEDMNRTVDAWLSKGHHDKLCQYWTMGGTVNWDRLYRGTKPQRMGLPTYPFERERFWVPDVVDQTGARPAERPAVPPEGRWYEQLIDDLDEDRITLDEAVQKAVGFASPTLRKEL
jgi:amino acid adenylation domain-containing protein